MASARPPDMPEPNRPTPPDPGALDRFLRVFSDVRPGESVTTLLLLGNIFLVLVGYYIIKTVREPLILASGGAEMRSYAAAGQALALMGFIPLYSWFSSRVERLRLIFGLSLFFIVNIEMFYLGALAKVPYLGFVFFIWVGIFSLATIAQFWSYANDLFPKETGERLFPIIAIGATLGSPLGSKIAQKLFEAGVAPYNMLHVTVVILLLHLGLYAWIDRREAGRHHAAHPSRAALGGEGGFPLVLKSPYLRLIALLLILLNIVNTTGEYIISRSVAAAATAAVAGGSALSREAFIGSFYGQYFFWVNVTTVLIQAFLVSRIVKYLGIAGVVLALPLVALGAYGIVAAGAGFAVIRWAKTAENATDYSVMNTGKQLLWLPTSRDEKYKAKQAVDTFFVRTGDVLSAGIVFAGTTWLGLGLRGFALTNLVVIGGWLAVAGLLLREHRAVVARRRAEAAAQVA
jgi:ATP:ADP antiporter, AAA family